MSVRPKIRSTLQLGLFVALFTTMLPWNAWAETPEKEPKRRFSLGVGAAVVKFDTEFKFSDKKNRVSLSIDAEKDLGLPASNTVGTLYGLYEFHQKHYLGFAYFRISRESTLLDGEFQSGDVTVNGKASLVDRTQFYSVNYGYALFKDERSQVLFTAGLEGLDLKYTFEAQGEITIDGVTQAGSLKEEASVFAPLPMFGLNFWYAYTPKWGISTKVSLVGGTFQDVSAFVAQTSINTRYQFSRRVGAVFGVTYFDADINVENDTDRTEIDYGYAGVFLGIHATF